MFRYRRDRMSFFARVFYVIIFGTIFFYNPTGKRDKPAELLETIPFNLVY